MPGAATLLVTQAAQLAFQASSNGAARVLTGVTWRSSNPAVASITPTGTLVALAPGTVTVEAHSGLIDSAGAQITVAARETRHYVQASAVSNINQLGTSALPFATLTAAAQIARAGDTVYVASGQYVRPVTFDSTVVVIGTGTPAAPALLAPDSSGTAALTLDGSGRSEVHNLTITTGYRAVAVGPVDTLVIDSLTASTPAGLCGDAAIAITSIPALYVRNSHLIGGGSSCDYAIEINGNAGVVVVDSTEISDFGEDALYVYDADSVAIIGSNIHNNYAGIEVSGIADGTTSGGVPNAPTVAVVIDSTRLTSNLYDGLYTENARMELVAHSFIAESLYEPVYVVNSGTPSGTLHLHADSLAVSSADDWLVTDDVDSVLVDSTRVFGSVYEGYIAGSQYVQVQTTSLQGLLSEGAAFDIAGGTVVMDSVSVRGSPTCSMCATAITTADARTTLSRIVAQNLYQAITTTDTAFTLTGANISDAEYGVYGAAALGGVQQTVNVTSATITGTYFGIYLEDRTAVISGVNISGATYGVLSSDGKTDTVRASSFTNDEYGVYDADTTSYVANNVFMIPTYAGTYMAGTSVSTMLGNTVSCDSTLNTVFAAYGYGGDALVQNNTITDCTGGVYLYGGSDTNTVTVRGNTLVLPSTMTEPGIYLGDPRRAVIVGNTFTGGDPSASIYLEGGGAGSQIPNARVDSNTVQSPLQYGFYFENVDTLEVRGNLIQDFVLPTSAANDAGAILVSGGTASASSRLVENTLRRTHGNGIVVYRADTSTTFVDSNAISHADSAGVYVLEGKVSMTGDNLGDNHRYGVYVGDASAYLQEIHGSAFAADSAYAVRSPTDSTDASANWWNSVSGAHSGPGSDSTQGHVNTSSPLNAPPGGVPGFAPPAPPLAQRASPALTPAARTVVAAAPARLASRTTPLAAPAAASVTPPPVPVAATAWQPAARDVNSPWALARLRVQRVRATRAAGRSAIARQLAQANAARVSKLLAVPPVVAPAEPKR